MSKGQGWPHYGSRLIKIAKYTIQKQETVWVKVDTIDFGQSEWSESLYFSTPATSNSEDDDIQDLIDQIVRSCFF